MNRYNHYRNSYENELKEKKDIDNSINMPILIVTLIFGAVSYFTERLNFDFEKQIDYVLLSLIGLTFVFLCLGIFRIIMSYNNGIKGYQYNIIGTPKEYAKYRKQLYKKFNRTKIMAESVFEEKIIKDYIACIDHNMGLNIAKKHQLFLAKTNIIISLMIIFITFFVFHLKQII